MDILDWRLSTYIPPELGNSLHIRKLTHWCLLGEGSLGLLLRQAQRGSLPGPQVLPVSHIGSIFLPPGLPSRRVGDALRKSRLTSLLLSLQTLVGAQSVVRLLRSMHYIIPWK